MRTALLAIVMLIAAGGCSAQVALFPRHIEQASYPQIALTALVQGDVTLSVTIGLDGRVTSAEAVDGPPLLFASAVKNIGAWTFDRPAAAPFVETFVYQFRIERQPVALGGCEKVVYDVSYDLPNRVTVIAKQWRAPDIDTGASKR